MTDKYSTAREKLAERILAEFKDKITGATDEPVIGDNPENKFFVGKLLTKDSDTNSGYSSDVFIESVGADFYIDKSEIHSAEITVLPRGEFYYRCYPTLEQQRSAMLKEANEMAELAFTSYEDLLKADITDPERFKKLKIKLVPVYKKISIASPNLSVLFRPSELLDECGVFGTLDERSHENELLMEQINLLKEQINEDPFRYTYVINEKTTIRDLQTQKAYQAFLSRNGKRDVSVHQNWSIYINVKIKRIKERYLISVALVNDSAVQSNDRSHQSNKRDKDKPTIETLFNSGIDILLNGAHYAPIELDYFLDDYKYDKEQQAIGLNCSVVYDCERNMLSTDHLPTFVQKRLITNDSLAVKFQDLIDVPLHTLKGIRRKMDTEIKNWSIYYDQKKEKLTVTGKEKMKAEISEFQREIERFQMGVDILEAYPIVLKSFILMNKAFFFFL